MSGIVVAREGCFIGTMGGSPASQVYFQNADLDAATSVVLNLHTSLPIIVSKKNLDGKMIEVDLKDIGAFKDACEALDTRECDFFAAFVDVILDCPIISNIDGG